MDGDVEIVSYGQQGPTDVAFEAEPELLTVGETGGQRFGDQEATSVATSHELSCDIQQRSWIEDLEDLWSGKADDGEIRTGQRAEQFGESTTRWRMSPLQQPPMTCCR